MLGVALLLYSFTLEAVLLLKEFTLWARLFFGALAISSGFYGLLVFAPDSASLVIYLLLTFMLVRLLNVARLVDARMHRGELRNRAGQTYLTMLLATTVGVLYVVLFDERFAVSLSVLLMLQLAGSVFLALSVFQTRMAARYRAVTTSPQKLPTVSVCIPARNETDDLPACIESVLASTYPKLEIIVLDDCSHDKTPDIIKQYAHDGVRFVSGKEPSDDWLAKNAAYDRLADEAQGDIVLFMGVDVRLEPDSVMQLVGQLGDRSMISVLPMRAPDRESSFFMQPIRYWWELGLWRHYMNYPPVLSTCWMIRKAALAQLGTFESMRKAVEPEAVFAKRLQEAHAYGFLVGNAALGVTSRKAPHEQYKTARRKRYPQLRRRPEAAYALIVIEGGVILAPFVLLPWLMAVGAYGYASLALVSIVVLSAANVEVYKLALHRGWLIGLVTMPLLVVMDVILVVRSLLAYEFGEVIWKERNICLPLLSVEDHLPKLRL